MKKLFITTLLTLGLRSIAFAQKKADMEIGVNTGLNYSGVHSIYFSSDTSSGFNFEFAADYFFFRPMELKRETNLRPKRLGQWLF